jgi:hypothetical protein
LIRAVLRTIPRKHQKEVAEEIKKCIEDPSKVADIVEFLEERRINKAIEVLERFQFDTHNSHSARTNQ